MWCWHRKGICRRKKKMPKNISVILKAAAWCHIYPELHLFKGPVHVNLRIFKENEHKLGLSVCTTTLRNKQTKRVFSHLKVRSWDEHGHGPPFCSWRGTVFPQGPKRSWLLDWQKQCSGKTFSLAVGILTTGHRQISHTELPCQISGFVSAFKRDSFEPSISFWMSGNHWKGEKSGVELAHKQPSHAVYSKGKMFLWKPNICPCNQRRILHGSARRARLGRDLTGCRWTCVEELQSEPVAAEHVVSKRSNHCTSLACCTGTSVKAGEARVCFHCQMRSAWVFSALGWESFLKNHLVRFLPACWTVNRRFTPHLRPSSTRFHVRSKTWSHRAHDL